MIPHDRRSSTRVDTGNLVIHSEVGQDIYGQVLGMAVTLDMNEFGLRIQTSERFDSGDRFRFSVALADHIVAATDCEASQGLRLGNIRRDHRRSQQEARTERL